MGLAVADSVDVAQPFAAGPSFLLDAHPAVGAERLDRADDGAPAAAHGHGDRLLAVAAPVSREVGALKPGEHALLGGHSSDQPAADDLPTRLTMRRCCRTASVVPACPSFMLACDATCAVVSGPKWRSTGSTCSMR